MSETLLKAVTDGIAGQTPWVAQNVLIVLVVLVGVLRDKLWLDTMQRLGSRRRCGTVVLRRGRLGGTVVLVPALTESAPPYPTPVS